MQKGVNLLHFLPNSSTNPRSSHSLTPNYPIVLQSRQIHFHPDTQGHTGLATPTESPAALGLLPPPPIPLFLLP